MALHTVLAGKISAELSIDIANNFKYDRMIGEFAVRLCMLYMAGQISVMIDDYVYRYVYINKCVYTNI
jgi:hypothetical protein